MSVEEQANETAQSTWDSANAVEKHAAMVGRYFTTLVQQGVPEPFACALTQQWLYWLFSLSRAQ